MRKPATLAFGSPRKQPAHDADRNRMCAVNDARERRTSSWRHCRLIVFTVDCVSCLKQRRQHHWHRLQCRHSRRPIHLLDKYLSPTLPCRSRRNRATKPHSGLVWVQSSLDRSRPDLAWLTGRIKLNYLIFACAFVNDASEPWLDSFIDRGEGGARLAHAEAGVKRRNRYCSNPIKHLNRSEPTFQIEFGSDTFQIDTYSIVASIRYWLSNCSEAGRGHVTLSCNSAGARSRQNKIPSDWGVAHTPFAVRKSEQDRKRDSIARNIIPKWRCRKV